tara:strand:- start:159 stop:1139 length:981 start_codon:yes stop_codon:yes gene_type:complete
MKFFKNKKVLVTGGAGFIGSHLTKNLVHLGAKVSVTVKYKSIIDSPRLLGVWDKINVIEADLRNPDSVRNMSKIKFDFIFHLAAYNHVGDSFVHINEAFQANLNSTINLMNSGPKFKKFINISSSEVYGYQKKLPFDPANIPDPQSPYALSKYVSELYGRLKFKESRLNVVSIRPFNTFGPYQSEKAIIPEIIIKCLLNEEIKTTKGMQTREFNYVQNIIDGILLCAKKINYVNQPINIGSNKPIKIKDLVKKIHKASKSNSKLKIGALKYRPNEIWKMQANNKFITKNLSWKPKISFDDGLVETINWYKKFTNIFLNKKSSVSRL